MTKREELYKKWKQLSDKSEKAKKKADAAFDAIVAHDREHDIQSWERNHQDIEDAKTKLLDTWTEAINRSDRLF